MRITLPKRESAKSHFLAFLLVAAALLIRLLIAPREAGLQYVTFFPAVTLSVFLCGFWPGITVTGVCTALATVLFTPPYTLSWAIVEESFMPNIVFIIDGIIVCLSIEGMHRYRRRYKRQLQEAQAAFRQAVAEQWHKKQMMDHLLISTALLDIHSEIVDVNRRLLENTGYNREDLIGHSILDLPCWSDDKKQRAKLLMSIQRALEGDTQQYDMRLDVAGKIIAIELQIAPVVDTEGQISHLLAMWSDVSARKTAEEQLRIAAVAFETHDAIMVTDGNAKIIRVNKAFEKITGYTEEEVLGKTPHILKSGYHNEAFYTTMWKRLQEMGEWSGEIWDRHKNGEVYPKLMTITGLKDQWGERTQYVAIFTDITELKKAEDQISHLAFYDALTGLPNRRLLLDRLQAALPLSARTHCYGAVLFIDMDRFKTLNDTMGHSYGDLLLIEVTRRLQASVRQIDTVARWGGDEFVILIKEISASESVSSQRVAIIAEKIRQSLSAPYELNNHQHYSSPSIGVYLYKGEVEPVDNILKFADIAMYQAKESGRNTVRFFDTQMQETVEQKVAIKAELYLAISRQQLRLFYQIQVDNSRNVLGVEALVRWIHPDRGMIPPMQFIPLAEECSLILDVGHWVLEAACQQLLAWGQDEKTRHLTMAVNVSPKQFESIHFVDSVVAMLKAYPFRPSLLKLELTESVILKDITAVVAKMEALREVGIGLSMDDFGTGYSSLSYLKKLPLTQLKIDQSFVRDLTSNPSDAMMVKTIIDLAGNFRLEAIAEGVETEEHLDFLQKNGCKAYQGYLFGKPVPIEALNAVLRAPTTSSN